VKTDHGEVNGMGAASNAQEGLASGRAKSCDEAGALRNHKMRNQPPPFNSHMI